MIEVMSFLSLVAVSLAAYFLPNIIAYGRGHNSAHAILALNLLLGWTGFVWLASLVWSLTGNTKKRTHGNYVPVPVQTIEDRGQPPKQTPTYTRRQRIEPTL